MNIFSSSDECIDFSRSAITQFSFLKEIIEPNDFTTWSQLLCKCTDIHEFIFGINSKLNLLNTSILIGFSIDKSLDNELFAHYKMLFRKLDLYLSVFPELITNRKFKDKIKNLEKLNFLSTLSELSLAYNLKELGFKIKFETKFEHLKTGKHRDIDLSVSDHNNNEVHFEVYMPNKQLNINGFFDPHQDDSHFAWKIEHKLFEKFGREGICGLNGLILLAVNKVFFDMLHVKTVLPILNIECGYINLEKLIPQDVDGLLIFEDSFGHENSYRFERIILKNEQ